MIKIAYIIVLFSGFITCPLHNTNRSLNSTQSIEGKVELIARIYRFDSTNNFLRSGILISNTIWCKDSSQIHQVKGVVTTSTNRVTETTFPVYGYLYKYFPTETIYEYGSFSDTARLLQKFGFYDSVMLKAGQPFYEGRTADPPIFLKALNHTVIDGKKYKREILKRTAYWGAENYYMTYFLCNDYPGIFDLYNLGLPKSNPSCPVIKWYGITSPSNYTPHMSEELILKADTISASEKKVFDAWEKRAREDAKTKETK